MEVSSQIHAMAALLPGKEPPVHIGEKAGWAPEPVGKRWWGGKNPFPYWEPGPGCPTRSL